MFQRARFPVLFFLVSLSATLTLYAQDQQPYARFAVEPSDPGTLYGVGLKSDEFRFTADVSDATCYEVDFNDGVVQSGIGPGPDGKAVFSHHYATEQTFTAVMRAWRGADCDHAEVHVRLPLEVRVVPPPEVPVPPPSYSQFSVEPSRSAPSDAEAPWADFTFTANVSDAESYTLDYGDGAVESDIEPDLAGRAMRRHVYGASGVYIAKLMAWRNSGESIQSQLLVTVQAPPPTSAYANFSVTPSDPETYNNVETPWADFIFAADVTEVESFELDFGDGVVETDISPDSNGQATRRHVYAYESPRVYTATLKAWRKTGELIQSELLVAVQAPPLVTVPPRPDTWRWYLIAALVLALLWTAWKLITGYAGSADIRFEPTRDRGRFTVSGSNTADDTVSMRVHRDAGQVVISTINGEPQ